MKKKEQKIVYYTDELNDDFAGNKIKRKPLKENFNYIKRGPLWTFCAWFVYYILAVPFGAIFCWLKFRTKVKNRKVLKQNKKKGYFLYANHTQKSADAFLPALSIYPKRNYILVNQDAVSVKGIKSLVLMLGGIPVASTLNNLKLMKDCVGKRIKKKHVVTIYPEAHIWPYYNKIRNFKDTSFKFPVDLNVPVYSSTIVYRKRTGISKLWSKKPFATIYVDGPFYPDQSLHKKDATKKLRDEVYNAMCNRVEEEKSFEYIKYVKKEKDQKNSQI